MFVDEMTAASPALTIVLIYLGLLCKGFIVPAGFQPL
jgi:hypothetical protein